MKPSASVTCPGQMSRISTAVAPQHKVQGSQGSVIRHILIYTEYDQ